MSSPAEAFQTDNTDNLNEISIVNKYSRHVDEIGRLNNHELSINARKFGEDRSPYIVEAKESLSKNRRPEAGHYLDRLLNESFIMKGPGENVTVVKSFEEMNLNSRLMQNIREKNYFEPLPIQRATFSLIQAGFDVIGHAITGGGKTAAFLIPIINYISNQKNKAESERNIYPYCIVISPTKELAEQLYEDTRVLSAGLNCMAVLSFGEIPRQDSIARIKGGCDIFISTVGRLCDYLQKKVLELRLLRFLVFDEADRLLQDEEFHRDLVENLLSKCCEIPNLRKLLFSATDYNDLAELKEEFSMPNVTKVVVGVLNSVNPFIEQRILNVEIHKKREALLDLIQDIYLNDDEALGYFRGVIVTPAVCPCLVEFLHFYIQSTGQKSETVNVRRGDDSSPPKTIIFVNTKRFATVIACYLSLKGYKAYPIHGNLTAKLRREAIEALQNGDCHILVSTDVAARGLDIKGISHIINYEIPKPESFLSYVHRVGRTGRVGNVGLATTFFAPSVDNGMALILYGWLERNKQEIPVFLIKEAERQIGAEDLQRKTREEYERALNKSYMESSDGEMDR
ncbi:DEAD-box ATP-dependent RNA helicase [Dirofilaria immitis]